MVNGLNIHLQTFMFRVGMAIASVHDSRRCVRDTQHLSAWTFGQQTDRISRQIKRWRYCCFSSLKIARRETKRGENTCPLFLTTTARSQRSTCFSSGSMECLRTSMKPRYCSTTPTTQNVFRCLTALSTISIDFVWEATEVHAQLTGL